MARFEPFTYNGRILLYAAAADVRDNLTILFPPGGDVFAVQGPRDNYYKRDTLFSWPAHIGGREGAHTVVRQHS